jgi:hypothetical protein
VSESVRFCEMVELGKRKCAQIVGAGAGKAHVADVFVRAMGVGDVRAREKTRGRILVRSILVVSMCRMR